MARSDKAPRLASVGVALLLAVCGCARAQPPASGTALAGPSVMPGDGRVADATWEDLALTVEGAPRALAVSATLDGAKLRYFLRERAVAEEREPPALAEVPETLREVRALEAERIAVREGELLVVDARHPINPALWIDDIAISIEGLATRARLMENLPGLIAAHGRIGGDAPVDLVVAADPFASQFSMAGWLVVRDLRATKLYEFLYAYLDTVATRGTVSLYLAFQVKDGQLRGAVKVIARDVELEPTAAATTGLAAEALDLATDLLADDPLGRDAVATVIPFGGPLTTPDVQLGTAVLGLVYNAFVEGLRAGFTGVPPERAETEGGFLSRLSRVLFAGKRPRAQPPPDSARGLLATIKPSTFLQADGMRQIQRALAARGHLRAPYQGGHLDVATRVALRRFQQEQALAKTGFVDYATARKLGVPVADVFREPPWRSDAQLSRPTRSKATSWGQPAN